MVRQSDQRMGKGVTLHQSAVTYTMIKLGICPLQIYYEVNLSIPCVRNPTLHVLIACETKMLCVVCRQCVNLMPDLCPLSFGRPIEQLKTFQV